MFIHSLLQETAIFFSGDCDVCLVSLIRPTAIFNFIHVYLLVSCRGAILWQWCRTEVCLIVISFIHVLPFKANVSVTVCVHCIMYVRLYYFLLRPSQVYFCLLPYWSLDICCWLRRFSHAYVFLLVIFHLSLTLEYLMIEVFW